MLQTNQSFVENPDFDLFEGILIIFFSFSFAFNFGNSVHELGHAFVHWINGEYFITIVLHPFLMPKILNANINQLGLENVIAGWTADLLISLILFFGFWRKRSPKFFAITDVWSTSINFRRNKHFIGKLQFWFSVILASIFKLGKWFDNILINKKIQYFTRRDLIVPLILSSLIIGTELLFLT